MSMEHPPYLSTMIFKVQQEAMANLNELSQRLRGLPGVAEVAMMPDEGLAYLKVDKKIVDEHELRKCFGQGNLP